MIRTELELAVRITVDLSRPTCGQDREMLAKALKLSREIHAIRGTSDPAINIIEQALVLPASAPSAPATPVQRRVTENEKIRDLLARDLTVEQIAGQIGLSARTIARRIVDYHLRGPA